MQCYELCLFYLDRRIILKLILKKYFAGLCPKIFSSLFNPLVGYCEQGDELLDFIKGDKLLDYIDQCQLHIKDSASWS